MNIWHRSLFPYHRWLLPSSSTNTLPCRPHGRWRSMLACNTHGISSVGHGDWWPCTFRDSFWCFMCTWLEWGLFDFLEEDGYPVSFSNGRWGWYYYSSTQIWSVSCFIAELMHGYYQVLALAHHNKIYTAATDFWQQALGHSSTRFCTNAADIYGDGSILLKRPSEFFCPACAKNNSKHSVPLPVSSPQSKNPFNLIQSDLLGPLSFESLWRRKYMLTFVEDKTRYSEVNFLHKKSDAPRLIKAFCEKVNTQTQRYPRSFRTD